VGGDQIVVLERGNCKSTFGCVLGFKDPGCVEEQVFFEPVISRFKYQAVDGD
jgi:hypothetical protein